MVSMRKRVAGIIAAWLIGAVAASAVTTCVPGAMQMQASQVDSCADMAGMDPEQPCVSGVATDCCTHHEPSLTTAKADLLKAPLQLSPWLAWIAPVVIVPTTLSVITAESPPELISPFGPPTYIALSTLRV